MNLTREAELAARWDLSEKQFRLLRQRHGWAHVKFSRQDVRYTDAQIDHIVTQMTVTGKPVVVEDSGLTARSAARSAS